MQTDFEKLARDLSHRRYDPYQTYTIDLTTAHDNMRIPIAGDIILVDKSSSSGLSFDIKFNNPDAADIRFDNDTKIETLFKEIYITNSAQSGKTLTLIIGVKEFFRFFLRSSGSGGRDTSLPVYFGEEDTDGSWRIIVDGTDLIVEKRESGTWNAKSIFTP